VRTTEKEVSVSTLRHSERQHNTGGNLLRAKVTNVEEPQTLKEAFYRENGSQWR